MSQVCISYNSLIDASSEANSVAKKLEQYASNLNSQIYKKLDNYNGDCTTNVLQAKVFVNDKISELNYRAKSYRTYSEDLKGLSEECIRTDKAVRSKVSMLTSSFKQANGIKDSKVVNALNYYLTSIENSTAFGRWIGNKRDERDSRRAYIRQKLEDWWDYEGGAEFIKGVSIGILESVIALCGIVGAFSAGSLIAIIAGVVAGAIALYNGYINIKNEFAAHNTTKNGDPATGRRRSEINTIQDYYRSSFYYGDDGEEYKYNPKLYAIANGIDVVNFVCTVITFIDGVGELIKKAYKWTTGSMAKIGDLRVKDILTKENFTSFKSKLVNGIDDIRCAVKTCDLPKISEFVIDCGNDFINNLKKGYTFEIFAEDKKFTDFIKHGASLIKNYATISEKVISGGINFENLIGNIGIKRIVLNNINIANCVTYDGKGRGVFSYSTDTIKLTDVTGRVGDFWNSCSDFGDILEKLNSKSDISIEIPNVSVPKISGINSINVHIAY